MANKAISELPQALNVNNQDLFVLEQSGIAKKLTAETFITEQGIIDALAEALDGHGGISSVTLSSVSGRIRTYLITFTDETTTTFQVLDGTSIDRIVKTSTAGLTDTYTVFMSDGTTTFFTVTNGADGTVSEAMLNDALKDKAPAITETTESSAIANFTDGADDLVMHNIVAEIEPVQSGSGDPSPDNVRPISGWTGCNVTRTGKNLLEKSFEYYTNVSTDLTNYFLIKAGTYNFNFASSTATAWRFIVRIKDLNGNVLSDSYHVPSTTLAYRSTLYGYTNGSNTTATDIKLTFVEDCYIRILYWQTSSSDTFTNCQLELGSSATAYEPYITPATASLSWQDEAGTVYGGTIDVATGLLTVTNGYIASYNGEALPSTWISDRDVYSSGTTPTTGAQVVYVLDTPQTYQLTPQEVKTLLGTNNIWADTGNTSVTYTADTKMFIEKLTMPTEDDLVANQAITSGKYFMIGNSLYLALANIASGAQITIGTNAQRVSLADALNTINS